MQVSIQGIQEAQRDNLAMIRALQPGSGMGEAVRGAAVELHRYSVVVTHVDTGALRASHRIRFGTGFFGGAEAEISIDEGARNPRSGTPPRVYGPAEHARGGSHAFYERTYDERGDRALEIGAALLIRSLR